MMKSDRFETIVLPHLDAAYNLARWLVHDPHQAEDIVQEACVRAFRFFDQLRGNHARPWLLGIVRNACIDHLRERRAEQFLPDMDEDYVDTGQYGVEAHTPESLLLQKCSTTQVDTAIAALPAAYREVIVLREIEEMSYELIAEVAGVPIGTVMSRLSRARGMLRAALLPLVRES